MLLWDNVFCRAGRIFHAPPGIMAAGEPAAKIVVWGTGNAGLLTAQEWAAIEAGESDMEVMDKPARELYARGPIAQKPSGGPYGWPAVYDRGDGYYDVVVGDSPRVTASFISRDAAIASL